MHGYSVKVLEQIREKALFGGLELTEKKSTATARKVLSLRG